MSFKKSYTTNIQPPTQLRLSPVLQNQQEIRKSSTPDKLPTTLNFFANNLTQQKKNTQEKKIGLSKLITQDKKISNINQILLTNKQNNNPINGSRYPKSNNHQKLYNNMFINNISSQQHPPQLKFNKTSTNYKLNSRPTTPNNLQEVLSPKPDQYNYQSIQNKNLNTQQLKNVSTSNLNSSNSFKTLLESKNQLNSPNLNPKTLSSKNKSQAQLRMGRKSLNNTTGSIFFRKDKDIEKKIIPQLFSPQHSEPKKSRRDQLSSVCFNGDGKRAKYKLSQNSSNNLVYCSKCAIMLVQQGFPIQQIIQQNSINNIYQSIDKNSAIHLKSLLSNKIDIVNKQRQKLSNHFQSQIQQMDNYYKTIISVIDNQRIKSRNILINLYNQLKQIPDNYYIQLTNATNWINLYLEIVQDDRYHNYLEQMQPNIKAELKKFNIYLQKDIQIYNSYKIVEINLQKKYQNFLMLFNNQIKLSFNLDNYDNELYYQHYGYNNKIDYQQPLTSDKKNKYLLQTNMNPLTQQSQEQSYQQDKQNIEINKNAFRNLFPDQSEQIEKSQQKNVVKSPNFKQF